MIVPTARIVVKLTAVLFAALAIGAGTLAWRLSQGPLPLTFLTPYLAQALSLVEKGYSVTVSDTRLVWDRDDGHVDVRVADLKLIGPEDQVVLSLPEAAVGLSVRALLVGQIAPTTIDLWGLNLLASRDSAGVLNLDIGQIKPPAAEAPAEAPASEAAEAAAPVSDAPAADAASEIGGAGLLAGALDFLANPESLGGKLKFLRRARFVDAKLTLIDELNQLTLRPERTNLILQREDGGVRGDVNIAFLFDGKPATVIGEAHYDAVKGTMAANVKVTDLVLASLAEQSATPSPLAAAKFPLSGGLSVAMDAERRMQPVLFDFRAGAGEIVVPEFFPDPIKLDRAEAKGRMVREGETLKLRFEIEQGSATLGATEAQFRGNITPGPIPGGEFEASLANFEVDRLGGFWPPALGVKARKWILAHIAGGVVENATFRYKLNPDDLKSGPIPEDAVRLEFAFSGASADYYNPLAPVTDVKGNATLTAHKFNLTASEGRIGDIAVGEGAVEVRDLHLVDQFATIEFVGSGQVSDMLGVLDSDPLNLIGRFGVKPADLGGVASARTRLDFIVEEALTADQIKVVSVANISQASVPNVVLDYHLSEGEMSLLVDNKGLEVEGGALLNGAPVTLTWREDFDPKNPISSRYALTADLDDEARRAIGYDTAPYVTGPTPGEMQIEVRRDRSATLAAQFDLRQAVAEIAQIGWSKPAGEPAQLKFDLAIKPEAPVRLDPFVLTGKDLSAKGDLVFDSAGQVASGNLTGFQFGENKATGRLKQKTDGGYALELEGPRFDLRSAIKQARRKDTPEAEKPLPTLDIGLKFDRAQVSDSMTLAKFTAAIGQVNDRTEKMAVKGNFEDTGSVSVDLKREGARRKLSVRSDNAGGAVRYIDVSSIRGGTFAIDAEVADDEKGAPVKGVAVMEKFKAVDAPLLAKVLAVAALTGIADVMRGEGISFERADVPFTLADNLLVLEQARSIGSAMGITAEGTYNMDEETLALQGAVIPAYTINSLLGKIPVLGPALMGGEHEGLFGINYSVTGPVAEPEVFVNPLSALTPGFLRKIFQLPDFGGASKAKESDGAEPDGLEISPEAAAAAKKLQTGAGEEKPAPAPTPPQAKPAPVMPPVPSLPAAQPAPKPPAGAKSEVAPAPKATAP